MKQAVLQTITGVLTTGFILIPPLYDIVMQFPQLGLFDILIRLNLLLLTVPVLFWFATSFRYDNVLLVSPFVMNLGWIVLDIAQSVSESQRIFSSVYFDLATVNFISTVLIIFVLFAKPFSTGKLTYILPYILVIYALTLIECYMFQLISSSSLLLGIIIGLPAIVLSVMYESNVNKEVLDQLISQISVTELVDLASIKVVTPIRYYNLLHLPDLVAQLQALDLVKNSGWDIFPHTHQDRTVLFRSGSEYDTVLNRLHQTNMFLPKGKLLQIFYPDQDKEQVRERLIYTRILKGVLVVSFILMISLLDFTFTDHANNLLFGSIAIGIVIISQFLFGHPVYKDMLPLTFGERKLMVFEKGIWTNITELDDDLRYIPFHKLGVRFDRGSVTIFLTLGDESLSIDVAEYLHSKDEIQKFLNIVEQTLTDEIEIMNS